jgi:DNA-binding response OmpR family regulator
MQRAETPVQGTPHVVVIDDDPDMRSMVAEYLQSNDMRVSGFESGRGLIEFLQAEVVDLLVLDLKLPGEDGISVARRVRDESPLPIIMLTGRTDEADRVMGLELGADDYLTKPFSTRELLARIRALLRRVRQQATVADEVGKLRAYRFGGWELNVRVRKIKSPDGRVLPLTNGEFSLLTAFLTSPRRVLTRAQLLDLTRLYNDEIYERSIDAQVLRLRRRIEVDPSEPRFILTERGVGYFFDADVETI